MWFQEKHTKLFDVKKLMNCSVDIVFIGHEIRPCDKTCGKEKCVLCPTGLYQPFLSHSDDPIRKQCFKPDLECNPRGMYQYPVI